MFAGMNLQYPSLGVLIYYVILGKGNAEKNRKKSKRVNKREKRERGREKKQKEERELLRHRENYSLSEHFK